MSVTPISSDNGIFAANAASSASGSSSTSEDSDMFLQLMVAQMKYQDPMNPTDTSTMLTQNATFTEVQAIQEMQSEMGMVLSSQLAFGSAAMIGKNVSWVDANGKTQSGTVSGVSYTTSGPVVTVGDQQVSLNSIGAVGDISGSAGTSSGSDTGSTSNSTGSTSGTTA
ncbi:flagellar hook capping FlgD N-terminal domain-containing protein [Nocardioides sp. BP30]|uniref:flagellar hook assembly protein FlgD n=1 Tax=Nocardioides sp. BP30 TaxID=3036374 RepID=UPI0024693623|nr:flagellar hook capping FlgD N-terminal domain-containing protein [Nocardioides sp. BP30]WGL51959.1 flagellar hook capping FlgD N-terminal domain-containing protein [Nocardioides sp. BP30]